MDFTTYLVMALVALGVLIGIYIFLIRYTISLKRQLWNQKQTVKLLCIIAKRLGEDPSRYISVVEEKTDAPDDQI